MASIFINYRRHDSAGYAGRLYDDLVKDFGEDAVFMDISTIPPGKQFSKVIEDALESCQVQLVIIGPKWLTIRDQASGRRRLDDPNDYVRQEIVRGLERGILVIPLRVHGASVPKPDYLPDDLKLLVSNQAHEITDIRWDYDVGVLIKEIAKVVGAKPEVATLAVPQQTLDTGTQQQSLSEYIGGSAPRDAVQRLLVNYVESNENLCASILRVSPEDFDGSLQFETELRREIEKYAPAAFPDLSELIARVGDALETGNRLIAGVVDSIRHKQYPLQPPSPLLGQSWKFLLYDRHGQLRDHINREITPQLASLRAALSQSPGVERTE